MDIAQGTLTTGKVKANGFEYESLGHGESRAQIASAAGGVKARVVKLEDYTFKILVAKAIYVLNAKTFSMFILSRKTRYRIKKKEGK